MRYVKARWSTVAAFVVLATACDGSSDPIGLQGVGLPPAGGGGPSIGVAVSGTVSLSRGTSGHVAVTVERVIDFNGLVTLSAEGLPAGVTAGFAPATVPNTTSAVSTLTLTASATAALGTVPVTIHARAVGVGDATVRLEVGVTP